jgi:hypothetical protein
MLRSDIFLERAFVFHGSIVVSLTPPMLVLRIPSASQLAQPHVPPAGVITTGIAPKKSLKQIQNRSNLSRW